VDHRAAQPVVVGEVHAVHDQPVVGRQVTQAIGGSRVGGAFRDVNVDTDAVLPGQSGPHLARQIEADRPSLRVLFISGYSDDAILRLGLLNEQEAFLQKPFGPRTFVHKVQQVLRG